MSAIDQITNALADQKDIEAVHIVSHGSEGSLKLGADVLNEHNLETFSTQIKQWGNALTANGDILLYGCDVAAGEVGENFVKRLSEITGADVAASTNKTGNAALGGDWNLEYSTGKIESPLAFKSTVLKDYQSTLGTLVSETFTGSSVTGPWIWALAGASTPPGLTAGSAPNTPLQNLNLDTAGNGALRLTSANTSQAGFVLYNNPLSSTEGVKVTFDFFAYNGVGSPPGDGLSFFLVDGTANPTSAGNGGGGLGYNTLIGGYVGIGFDEYGGFGSTGQDSVAIRGSTASSNTLLQSVSVAGQGGIDAGTVANRNTALRRAQIILTPSNAASPNRLSVAMDFNNNGSFTDAGETIIAPFDITTSNGAVPTTLKFGFAASTGGSTDVHEIRNLIYETVDAPPTVTTFTPADNATTVAVAANLVVTLSEAVQKGTGNIVIKKVSDNSVVETINVTAANVTVSGSTVTVNPTADLAQGTGYYVEIAAGAIKDLAGNNYAGTTGATTWNFTTVADTTAPTAATFTPADNATTVAVTDNLVVTLSEAVQKGTGNIVIKKVSDNSVVETINVTAANVTVSGSTVTVNPTADLAQGTGYYVEIAAGAIKDLAGNNYAGTTGATTWNFTTVADTTAPTAATFTPADNATTVAVTDNLVVTLSEAVQKGTGNIVIKKVSDNSVVETINVTAANVTVSGSTVTVNPTADLAQGTGYYVEIAAGAIKDLAGNNYAGTTGATTWNFTTVADTTAPTAATFTPADNATTVAVAANLVVTLSEAVQKGTGNIVIKKVSDNSVVETINVTAANVTVSGSTVTVNPTADLAQGTGYYVEIAAGAIKDLAGNNYAGTTGATTWNFTTVADTTAPTAATFTPADNATTVAVTDNLVVTLSEAVQKGTGNIVIKKVSDNSVVETINVTAANVTVSGSTVTVNPTADLAQGTGYYVEIAAGAIKDLAGNNYAGTTGATTWNFTTVADTTAPTAATFTPADNATTVAVTDNLVVTLSEAVQKGTGNIVIKKVSDNSVVETINVTAANVTVSGSTVTVNPTADLAQGTGYYVEIAAGAIKDLAGNNYAGTTGATTWNFTTVADTTAPTAATFTPADNATTVAVAANLVVTLSEAVQKGTGNIVIKKVSDNSVVETINVTAANVTVSGSTVTVNPTADLAQGTGYYVEIAAGAIKDLAGNNYAGTTGATTWNFTTVADTTAPTAATFTPADNATTVAVTDNLVVTLSEAVQKGTGNIVIKKVSDNSVVETINVTAANVTVSGSTVTVNPTADLAQGTGYYVEIAAGAIKDLAGNNYAGTTGATTWNFTTVADTTAPTAATFTPADNATTVAVTDNLVVTLSEAVQKGTGNIVIKKVSDNSVVETINVTAANVTVSGSTVTVNPTADLAQGTGYYVEIAAGAIKDLAGNNYAGTTGATTWNFTTVADTTAPTAATFTPADNATTVAVTDNLVVTLSEAVQKGTGNIVIKKVSDNSVVETINVTSANVTVSGSTVTVNPTADLAQGTGYYVEIAAGAIKDLAGNNYAGTTGATTWNFTTVADTTAPTAATFTPADNATTVAVTDNLVVTLSEAVQKGTGNIVIKKVSDNSVVETINVTAANVTVSGSTVTVNPTADLAHGTGYYVEIACGCNSRLSW
ncbi:MAG: Ig-like domain-containing protein [Microcoleus sp.]